MKMKKRLFIITIALICGLTMLLTVMEKPSQAFEVKTENGKKVVKLKAQTIWPPTLVFADANKHFVETINKLSNGRVVIELHASGSVVPYKEQWDAVKSGVLDMASDYPGYWSGKGMPALDLLLSVAFGHNPMDNDLWWWHRGGRDLLLEIYNENGLHYILDTVLSMESGIRSNKPIKSVGDLKGFKVRMGTKPAQYAVRKLGGRPLTMATSEIYTALERGTLDGAELATPADDYKTGVHEITKYNAVPGWHQPMCACGWAINLKAWNALDDDLKELFEVVGRQTYWWSWGRVENANVEAMKKLSEAGIEVTTYSKEDLDTLRNGVYEYIEQLAAKDPMAKRMAQSYWGFFDWYKERRKAMGPFGWGYTPETLPKVFD
jgi:TRAP-type mannitol/chloroaromatic compound transport system substrate-binding protein